MKPVYILNSMYKKIKPTSIAWSEHKSHINAMLLQRDTKYYYLTEIEKDQLEYQFVDLQETHVVICYFKFAHKNDEFPLFTTLEEMNEISSQFNSNLFEILELFPYPLIKDIESYLKYDYLKSFEFFGLTEEPFSDLHSYAADVHIMVDEAYASIMSYSYKDTNYMESYLYLPDKDSYTHDLYVHRNKYTVEHLISTEIIGFRKKGDKNGRR